MNNHSQSLPNSQGLVSVKRCGCGGIHVSLGGVSINLAQETARFLKDELERVCLDRPVIMPTNRETQEFN